MLSLFPGFSVRSASPRRISAAIITLLFFLAGASVAGAEHTAPQQDLPVDLPGPADQAVSFTTASMYAEMPNAGSGTLEAGAETPAHAGSEWPAEFFLNILYETTNVDNGKAQAYTQGPPCFIFCTGYDASKSVDLEANDTIAVRAGFWAGGSYHYLGASLELGSMMTVRSPGDETDYSVKVEYNPLWLQGMLRIPIVLNDMPRHQVDLYAGPAILLAGNGNGAVTFPELPQSVSGSVTGSGLGYFAGLSWRYARLALFIEQRWASISFDSEGDPDAGSLSVSFKMEQHLFGLSWRF
jgi:hypothetical protein